MGKDAKSNGKQIKQLKSKNYDLSNEIELLKEKSKIQEKLLETFKKTVMAQEQLCIAVNEYLTKSSHEWVATKTQLYMTSKIVDKMLTEGILNERIAPTLDGQLAIVKYDYVDERGNVRLKKEYLCKLKAFKPVEIPKPKKKSTKKKKKSTKKTTKKSKAIPTRLSLEEQNSPPSLEEKKSLTDFIKAHPNSPEQRLNVDKLKGEKKNDPKKDI